VTAGTQPYAGYHTVTLDRPALLQPGDTFAIIVKLTSSAGPAKFYLENRFGSRSDPIVAAAGQSWSSTNGLSWTDLGRNRGANLTIKALTNDFVDAITSVTVGGSGHLGSSLSAVVTLASGPDTPNLTPESEAQQLTLSYQWYRNGLAIDGATAESYVVTEADQGRRLNVRVTASVAGYSAGTRLSDARLISTWSANLTSAAAPESTELTLAATTSGTLPSGATLSYRWTKNGETIAGATESTLQVSDDGKHPQYSVWITVKTSALSESQSASVTPYGLPTLPEILERVIALLVRLMAFLSQLFTSLV
jgi:hypothetical protein